MLGKYLEVLETQVERLRDEYERSAYAKMLGFAAMGVGASATFNNLFGIGFGHTLLDKRVARLKFVRTLYESVRRTLVIARTVMP